MRRTAYDPSTSSAGGMHDKTRVLDAAACSRRLTWRNRRSGSRIAGQRARDARRDQGIEAHLLGRPDLLRQGQQAARRHDQQMGRRQRRRDRSRDDQPERDRAEGLGRGRVEHACPTRSTSVSTCCCCCRGRACSCRSTTSSTAIGKAQGGWFAPVATATDTSKVAGGRTGVPFGVSGNLLLRRNDVLDRGRLHQAAGDLGGAGRAGRGGEQAAALRARPRALQRRRRQRPDRGAAVLRRPHRRRRRHQGRNQVRRDARPT